MQVTEREIVSENISLWDGGFLLVQNVLTAASEKECCIAEP